LPQTHHTPEEEMAEVPPSSIPIALDKCDTTAFEKYAQTVFGAVLGNTFKPLGGNKDGGADGFLEPDIQEDEKRASVFFQASKEVDTVGKIRRTIKALQKAGREPKTLLYGTSRLVKNIDKIQTDLSDETGVNIRIYDEQFFEQRSNYNGDVQAAFFQHLQPAIMFLEKALAPSYPSQPVLPNAQIVSAFLSQEVERRIGTTQTLESVTDALILWALEETDPDTNKFMTPQEIIDRVEGVIPTAKQFFRGAVESRLKALSTKKEGSRLVNVYQKAGKYCLPYDSRHMLAAHAREDEALKVIVSCGIQERISAACEAPPTTEVTERLVSVIHRVLEVVFETQGFEASRHFLGDVANGESKLADRHIYEVAEEKMVNAGFKLNDNSGLLLAVKQTLRGIFYQSTREERAFCARLARTYILLFTIKNTPEVINYFNTMSKQMTLYVGSDLLVRAISEFYLPPEDQMTVNALKIIKQAGSRLVLTESMLEEVHSHIWGTHLEYNNHYLDVDSYVDLALASQASKILIRAYYYAKLDKDKSGRPTTWTQYLNNFLTPSKLTAPLAEPTMRELRDVLCHRYGLEFEPKEASKGLIDEEEASKLAAGIQEMRAKREEIAENDAHMILRIEAERKKERFSGNPYGYRTWYLTQDSVSNIAFAYCFRSRRDKKFVMRPEFLLNYIAYNPTDEAVRESLKLIFPSVLGVRLGSRLPSNTVTRVLDSIEEAHKVDPARAASIVADLADALKSNRMQGFALKYAPAN
jgi:hypothetical protein